MRRTFAILALAALALAALAGPAAAADGVGLWGRTTDKVVTFWGFGLIVFFPVLITVLSLIQGRLEKRKDRRKYELQRLNRS